MIKKIHIIYIFSLLFCNWEQVAFPNSGINGILFDNNYIYMIDFNGSVYQSTHNGENWEQISEITGILPYGIDVFKKIGDYLLVMQNTSSNIIFFRSYFNGQEWEEWEELFTLTSNVYSAVHYNEAIYVIANNIIMISTDYGNTWNVVDSPINDGNPNLLMINENYIYLNYGCDLYRASTLSFLWENITANLDQIGPPEPYSCTMINDLEFFNDNLIASVYWYGGVGTLLIKGNNQNEWLEIESFPAEYSNGFEYSISDLLFINGILYAGTASSQNGIFYTGDLTNWVEYSDGLESYNLSVNKFNSTNNKIFKIGGTVNYFKNNLVETSIVGDFNFDNILNILDIIILVNHILLPAGVELDGADINNDGNIDILDVIQLINIILN